MLGKNPEFLILNMSTFITLYMLGKQQYEGEVRHERQTVSMIKDVRADKHLLMAHGHCAAKDFFWHTDYQRCVDDKNTRLTLIQTPIPTMKKLPKHANAIDSTSMYMFYAIDLMRLGLGLPSQMKGHRQTLHKMLEQEHIELDHYATALLQTSVQSTEAAAPDEDRTARA